MVDWAALGTINDSMLRIVLPMIILLAGFIIGKVAEKVLHKLFSEIEMNHLFKASLGTKINLEYLISGMVAYAVYAVSLVLALKQAGILSYVFIILSAAVLFSISISIFLTLRDFLPNVIAGFYLFRRFEPGTKVRIGNSSGEIIRMDLFSIILKTEDEDMLYVPNSLATKSVLIVQAKK